MRIVCKFMLLIVLGLPLAGCSPAYYWQAMSGHLELMRQRRPVAEVIADASTPADLRRQLQRTTAVLEFAHRELLLPDNGSYATYADTGRDFVVWNVFAAGEFSLIPETWCFPVAGCVSYRGYFSAEAAQRFAARLRERGLDTFVGGVAAYSTLGRFRDPLLNNMMGMAENRLAGLLIHELAHQKLYVKDDSAFNESYASFVEQAGVSLWLRRAGDTQASCEFHNHLTRRAEVRGLLATARWRLENLYAGELPEDKLRARKAEIFAELDADYRQLRRTWSGPPNFDGWFAGTFNNARLVALSTYDEHVPAFSQLFAQSGESWADFYARVAALSALPQDQRAARLAALSALSESAVATPGYRVECPESADSAI
jgi:predicted aminopeptidase